MPKLKKRFDKFESESHEFDRIEKKLSRYPDVHAFLLLESILCASKDSGRDIIAAAEHDQIWLDGDLDELNKLATDDQIRDLVRCGVWIDEDNDSLSMFA